LVNACEPAYLTPNSGSLQKTIEGVSLAVENVGDRAAIGEKTAQKHIRNRKPQIPKANIAALNKGGYRKKSQQSQPQAPPKP